LAKRSLENNVQRHKQVGASITDCKDHAVI